MNMGRITLALLMATSMLLAGCVGNGEGVIDEDNIRPIWEDYKLIDERIPTTPGIFQTIDLRTNQSTNTGYHF